MNRPQEGRDREPLVIERTWEHVGVRDFRLTLTIGRAGLAEQIRDIRRRLERLEAALAAKGGEEGAGR